MGDEPQDIATIITHFIESLPTTIQPDILLFVMMYALDRDSTDAEIFVPTILQGKTKSPCRKVSRFTATISITVACFSVACLILGSAAWVLL